MSGPMNGSSVSDSLGELEAAIDTLLDRDPTMLTPQELLTETETLASLTAKLYAVTTRHLGVAEQAKAHKAVRSRSLARCVTAYTRDSGRAVGKRVRHASVLAGLPRVWDALAAGKIGESHVGVFAQLAARRELADALERDLEILLRWACFESYVMFWALVKAWAELNDPTDPAETDGRALNNRGLVWAQGLDGEVLAEINAPNVCWDQILEACRPVYDRLYEEDRAVAKAAHGDGFTHSQITRSQRQRWFDALMHVIRGGGAAVEMVVFVDDDTLDRDNARLAGRPVTDSPEETVTRTHRRRCETRNGLAITPSMALRLSVAAKIRRAAIDAPDLHLSTTTRLYRGPLRDAILARDRFCQGDGCETPAHRCQLDHRRPVHQGGKTTGDNGQPLCPACHNHKTKLETLGIW